MASDIVKEYKLKFPFDSDGDLVDLVNIYSDYDKGNFLCNVTHKRREEIPHEDIYNKNNNDLYVYLFNLWKNNLLSISYDDVKSGKYDITYEIMPVINYLKRIPDAKSKEDVDRYLNPKDNEVRLFINKYSFDSGFYSFWHKIDSKGLTAINSNLNIDSFLTLNIKRYDVPKFSKLFTTLCLEQNIPFSYRYNDSGNINDNFIINCDKRYLNNYVQIIRAILKKYPNLASRIGKPSYLVGYTEDKIGFAMGDYIDYYSKRADHIESCIRDISNHFIANNMKKTIDTDLGKISIIDYLSYEMAGIISEKQCNYAIENHSYPDYVKYNNVDYMKKVAIAIKKVIYKKLKSSDSLNEIIVNVDDSDIIIPYNIIECVIKKSVKLIFKNNPHLYSSLKSYIKISAKNVGIEPDYCIDTVDDDNLVKEKRRV